MSNPTTPFSWQMPTSTDLVTDLPADFEVFGQAVATSMADLLGGTTGQVLSKTTNADMDFTWVSPNPGDITAVNVTSPITGGGTSGDVTIGIQAGSTTQSGAVQLTDSTSSTSTTTAATPNAVKTSYDLANAAIAKSTVTTAGDIIYRNATVPTRLGIGTAGQVLQVNSGATAPEWTTLTTPSSGMTLISTINQSNVASVTMDNIFTSTYTKYVLVIDRWFALTAADDLLIKYRTGGSSGTDASANHYSGTTSNQFQGTTWTNINTTVAANLILQTQSDTTVGVESTINFNNIGPTAGNTQAWCYGIGCNGSDQKWFTFMGYNAAGATYTGLKFSSSASNIYIKASVYGLAS